MPLFQLRIFVCLGLSYKRHGQRQWRSSGDKLRVAFETSWFSYSTDFIIITEIKVNDSAKCGQCVLFICSLGPTKQSLQLDTNILSNSSFAFKK
jgi:hypothetical protein